MSAMLRITHPSLYAMARESMSAMRKLDHLHDIAMLWTSVFNGCQVISNRETPIHRDNNSHVCWYDLLCSVGPYSGVDLELPGAGLRFEYNTGTAMFLCGRLLRHGVSAADGDRVCLAYYMRENVQKRLGSKFAGWSHQHVYDQIHL